MDRLYGNLSGGPERNGSIRARDRRPHLSDRHSGLVVKASAS